MRRKDLNGLLLFLGSLTFIASAWGSAYVVINRLQEFKFLAVVVLAGTATLAIVVLAVLQVQRRWFSEAAFGASLALLLPHALLANFLMLVVWLFQGGDGWH